MFKKRTEIFTYAISKQSGVPGIQLPLVEWYLYCSILYIIFWPDLLVYFLQQIYGNDCPLQTRNVHKPPSLPSYCLSHYWNVNWGSLLNATQIITFTGTKQVSLRVFFFFFTFLAAKYGD